MQPSDQNRFPSLSVILKDGRTVLIRPLRLEDGPALAAFYEQIPAADQLFYLPHTLDREHAFKNAEKALSPDEVVLVIDDQAGAIGGYGWSRWQEGARESGFGICLLASVKGQGLGEKLMARLAEIARVVGPDIMHLTVQKKNPRAVLLYQKMGFVIVREQLRGGDNEPEYYMERKVR